MTNIADTCVCTCTCTIYLTAGKVSARPQEGGKKEKKATRERRKTRDRDTAPDSSLPVFILSTTAWSVRFFCWLPKSFILQLYAVGIQ